MVMVAKRLVLRLLAILEQVPLLSVWFLLCVALSYLDFGSYGHKLRASSVFWYGCP
jgi:hypothetical protein